ncbi:cytochrome P450 2L1-like [Penaeus japonicus]|uniref:cytochrome P450 2L1-like n=1 Tax=Penaeus japonicus TaxID=27405 RepID=UPI001C710041|nr:cytochrome P450 2L1-like [Penaeus japonicus]
MLKIEPHKGDARCAKIIRKLHLLKCICAKCNERECFNLDAYIMRLPRRAIIPEWNAGLPNVNNEDDQSVWLALGRVLPCNVNTPGALDLVCREREAHDSCSRVNTRLSHKNFLISFYLRYLKRATTFSIQGLFSCSRGVKGTLSCVPRSFPKQGRLRLTSPVELCENTKNSTVRRDLRHHPCPSPAWRIPADTSVVGSRPNDLIPISGDCELEVQSFVKNRLPSIMLVEIALVVVAVALLTCWVIKRPVGLPPDQLKDLQKQHGDIYLWRIGSEILLFLHSYKLAKEAFMSSDFVNRPKWDRFTLAEDTPLGLSVSNGHIWHSNRRFSLRQLKDLGMGKSRMTPVIHEEARAFVEALRQQAGRAGPVPPALKAANLNVIWSIIAGKKFEMDDPKISKLGQLFNDLNDAALRLHLLDFFPWLKRLPEPIRRRHFHLDVLEEFKDTFLQFCHEVIDEHKASMNPCDPRDLIDAYLLGMEETAVDGFQSEKDLAFLIMDLFIAGSELTTIVLVFMFHYLAMFPDVQRKLQEEIDSALPSGTLATPADRTKLPYAEAVLHEVLRVSSLDPIGVQRCAVKDTQLAGYTIPEGTVVSIAVAAMHHDPRYWDEPEKFLPERWIGEDGKFSSKKGFLPFGVGKRVCMGETLARMELLIFATAVYQSLSIVPPPGTLLDLTPDPNQPMIHNPRQQDIFVKVRQ